VVIEEARGVPRKYSTHNRISLNLSIEGGGILSFRFYGSIKPCFDCQTRSHLW